MFDALNYPCETPSAEIRGISYLATILIGGQRTRIRVPRLELPLKSIFTKKSGIIGCLATILIGGQRTPDSCSPSRVTHESIQTSHNYSSCRQCSFDPVTDKQTDRQTDRQTYLIL